MSAPRVSPPRVFPAATRAAKPPMGAEGAADAYRQLGFVLGADVELVLRGLALESAVVSASSGAKFRSQAMVAVVAQWSRSWLTRLQALHAVDWGNYTAALPLIRAAVDYSAASIAMLQDPSEWEEWIAGDAVTAAHGDHATSIDMHGFRSAETLAANSSLGLIYRAATDLSLPHFGSTILVTAADSSPERTMLTFGDRDFHFAMAELCLGWLTEISSQHLSAVTHQPANALAMPAPGEVEEFVAAAARATSRPDRCHIEVVERDGQARYLVHNWRRAPGAAAKKLLL